ncbi:MAG TPA: hypothetical protein VG096_04460 [Bryobacteraceae bacterium]|jgi:hypothetical protein|nr:hypothetical protein [Bryobacteraceae bacterium]
MRLLVAVLIAAPLLAQEQAAQSTTQPAAGATATESPAPSTEPWLTGSVDFGYRWRTDVGGNFQTYRSVINLGQGPKLLGLDFTFQDPKKRWFDRLDANAYGWGGDPYSTAHVDARKLKIYDFRFDYRNIAYFNELPSFANPFAPAGFNQQAFDIHRRMINSSLDLFPGGHIIPYLAFDRNAGYGHGIDAWSVDASNAYAVPTLLRDSTENYRGGVRFEYNHFHVTLEQGGTTFKDDDQAYTNQPTGGDRTTPLFGQTLLLNSLVQAYAIRGTSIYERALLTATPASWLTLSGQFLYSQPKTDVHYTDAATGNFVALASLLPFTGLTDLATGSAKQPHVTGNAGFEMRPFRKLRIVESWMTDRYHDASFGLLVAQFVPATTQQTALPEEQVVNYNQQEIDAIYDLTSKITVRGGWRYVWGDATVNAGILSQTGTFATGQLRRNVGLAGATILPWQKLRINVDYEGALSDDVYFRNSLNDYNKMRARAKYQASTSLSFTANFALLDNQNPATGVNYDFRARTNSVAVYWTPNNGKRISVTAEYNRSTVRSDIDYLNLPFLNPAVSSYRDNAHTASSQIDIALPGYYGLTPKLTAGGSLFVSSGSRPTQFYEPLGRLSIPFSKKVTWYTEWRWYGMGEQFYLYEGFRTHVFVTGLRLSR